MVIGKQRSTTMIEIDGNELVVRFPEVHETATLHVNFQRTLRIPDNNADYPLPPGLGRFPLAHVDDHSGNLPPKWSSHGGVFLPMYQAEALWICFSARETLIKATLPGFSIPEVVFAKFASS
jgi:hypothetical protein